MNQFTKRHMKTKDEIASQHKPFSFIYYIEENNTTQQFFAIFNDW